MTGLVVHQCPKCELRFSFRTELEYHLGVDHPAPEDDRAENLNAVHTADAGPAAAPAGELVPSVRRHGFTSKLRVVGLACAIAVLTLVAGAAAIAFSVSTAVVITALMLVLTAAYVRRARGRARIPGG